MKNRVFLQQVNKRGAALAFVIIIAAALMVMVTVLFTMAQSSIASADTGIKSREAYLSAKSGVEFIKSYFNNTTMAEAQSTLDSQVAEKDINPDHVVSIPNSTLYGYGSLDSGFIMNSAISAENAAFKDARIQITYEVKHNLTFTPDTDPEAAEGQGTYKDTITISALSRGKSPESSAFTGILEKGTTLTYEHPGEVFSDYVGVGEPSNVIPDTGGIPVNDEWPTEESAPGSGGAVMESGSTFIYGGSAYYVTIYNTWIEQGTTPADYPTSIVLINPGPARDINTWDGYPLKHNKTLADFNAWLYIQDGGANIRRGDKVVYNGIYYILRDDPATISWVAAPPKYPWFIIPNQ